MEVVKFSIPLSSLSWADSASAAAIRHACSPREALILFKSRLRRRPPAAASLPDLYDSNAAVFTLKQCSAFPVASESRIFPSFHAFLLKTNLLSCIHVSSALLHAYSLSSLPNALLLFDQIPNRNVVTYNTMITCHARLGNIAFARDLFDQMPQRDVASWSAIIWAYLHSGNPSRAFFLFREMNLAGKTKPDPLVLVTMLSSCAGSSSALLGKSIHAYIVRNRLSTGVQLGTSLISMYAKAGCLNSAFYMFEKTPNRNVMHWTAMICGLAVHGYCDEALFFFERMKSAGIMPNEITFTGVLNACRHAGRVEAGRNFFSTMTYEFGLEPGIHHYGCMIDLLANAGKLDDAFSMIRSMKIEPNVVIWTSLLSACKRYRNFEMAEKVIAEVLQITEPNDDGGVYTLVSDLYALGGRWNDVQKVRELMDRLCVKKKRGCSSFIDRDGLRSKLDSSYR